MKITISEQEFGYQIEEREYSCYDTFEVDEATHKTLHELEKAKDDAQDAFFEEINKLYKKRQEEQKKQLEEKYGKIMQYINIKDIVQTEISLSPVGTPLVLQVGTTYMCGNHKFRVVEKLGENKYLTVPENIWKEAENKLSNY